MANDELNGEYRMPDALWERLSHYYHEASEESRIDRRNIDETCVIADGSQWIWNQVKELLPTACEILDFYHCSGYIHEMASNQYYMIIH